MRGRPERGAAEWDELLRNAPLWMIGFLECSPSYVHWGPGEDFMWTDDDDWGASVEVDGWDAFGPWSLDDYNECVHFYFEVSAGRLNVVLWMLHPRKGASRGVRVRNLTEADADAAVRWLAAAAKRNADRFAAVKLRAELTPIKWTEEERALLLARIGEGQAEVRRADVSTETTRIFVTKRCDLCETGLELIMPGGVPMEFTGHTEELCRASALDRIHRLELQLKDAHLELQRYRRGGALGARGDI